MTGYTHAYLMGDLLLLPLWGVALAYRKDLHKELLVMSLLGGLLSVLFAPPFLKDYWHPIYSLKLSGWPFGGIEDFLNGFFVVGIASVAYEEIFGKRFVKRRSRKDGYIKYIPLALIAYIALFYIPVYLGAWSLYAAVLSLGLLCGFILILRRDLLADALVSGLILGLIAAIGYMIFLVIYPDATRLFWERRNLNTYLIGRVPVGEFLWAFMLGATSGPLYEFFAGRKSTPAPAKRR